MTLRPASLPSTKRSNGISLSIIYSQPEPNRPGVEQHELKRPPVYRLSIAYGAEAGEWGPWGLLQLIMAEGAGRRWIAAAQWLCR